MAIALRCFKFFPLVLTDRDMKKHFDFEPVYPRHDLLVEIGVAEMAMERLAARNEQERVSLQPRLETRIHRLREALQHMAA